MADLVTHLATGLLLKAATRGNHVAALLVGTVLPDLLGRVPGMAVAALRQRGLGLPEAWVYVSEVCHMPAGMVASSLLVASLFVGAERRDVRRNLLGGAFLHLGVDLTQHHLGVGYLLWFPFARGDFELGWIGAEATTPWALPLFAVSAAVWWWRRPLPTSTVPPGPPAPQEPPPGGLSRPAPSANP